jgi:hypothetical protein
VEQLSDHTPVVAWKPAHLMVDGVLPKAPTDGQLIKYLLWLPDVIKMHRITEPRIVQHDDVTIGIQIIAESHISVHTKGLAFYGDVFSCLPFAHEETYQKIVEYWNLWQSQWKVVERLVPAEYFPLPTLNQSTPNAVVDQP